MTSLLVTNVYKPVLMIHLDMEQYFDTVTKFRIKIYIGLILNVYVYIQPPADWPNLLRTYHVLRRMQQALTDEKWDERPMAFAAFKVALKTDKGK